MQSSVNDMDPAVLGSAGYFQEQQVLLLDCAMQSMALILLVFLFAFQVERSREFVCSMRSKDGPLCA